MHKKFQNNRFGAKNTYVSSRRSKRTLAHKSESSNLSIYINLLLHALPGHGHTMKKLQEATQLPDGKFEPLIDTLAEPEGMVAKLSSWCPLPNAAWIKP